MITPGGLECPSCLRNYRNLDVLNLEPLFYLVQSVTGKTATIPCHAHQAFLWLILLVAGSCSCRIVWLYWGSQRRHAHIQEILRHHALTTIPCHAMQTCSLLGPMQAAFHNFAIGDGFLHNWCATAHLWLHAMWLHVTRYIQQVRPRQ